MPYGTFSRPVTDQPPLTERGHAPFHVDNTHYPEIQETDLAKAPCSICMEAFVPGNTVGKLKGCGHTFHENCLLRLLGVPSIYLDPSEPHRMYPCCLRKAIRACGSNINCKLNCIAGCCDLLCLDIPGHFHSFSLNPARVELSDSDIALLHQPENPRFLADHLNTIRYYWNYCDNTEWFSRSNELPLCPLCRKYFKVAGAYTLYQVTPQ